MVRALAWLPAACILLTACGSDPVPCGAACPAVGGAFRVEATSQSGFCAFQPYRLPPELVLEQQPSGAASAEVLDPATLGPLDLNGQLYQPAGAGLADLALEGHALTPSGVDGSVLLSLRVVLAATVTRDGSDRVLVGTLTTTEVGTAGEGGAPSGCSATLRFTARQG